LITITFVV